jgi:hypothetical protein
MASWAIHVSAHRTRESVCGSSHRRRHFATALVVSAIPRSSNRGLLHMLVFAIHFDSSFDINGINIVDTYGGAGIGHCVVLHCDIYIYKFTVSCLVTHVGDPLGSLSP